MKFSRLFMVMLALITLLSLAVGCSSKSSGTTTTQTSQIPNTYTTYSDSTSLFSVSYPAQWETTAAMAADKAQIQDAIDTINGLFPISYNIMVFEAGLKTDTGYYPTINITVQPSPAGVNNTEQAGQSAINVLKKTDPNLQEISQNLITVSGKEAALVEVKVQLSTGLMHELLLVYLDGTNLWTLTCTVKDVDYSTWSNDFNNIVRTFVINKWPESAL